jgi:hypothetical protein
MNRTSFYSASVALSIALAAVAAGAAMTNNAYAETPTIDNTHFVSTRTRAEVRAEITPGLLSAAGAEWGYQNERAPQVSSGLTRAQAQAQFQASREQVNALNSEDSGSSYLARHAASRTAPMVMAGSNR